ncbi:MAG: hypothetical protein GXY76_19125 [Chloroflexi bacterium]|nr:hypothetical protein [Chloroflexota bacterium]
MTTGGDNLNELLDEATPRPARRRRERLVLPNWAWPLIGAGCVLAGLLLGWLIWRPGSEPQAAVTPTASPTVLAQAPTATMVPPTKAALPTGTNTATAAPTSTAVPSATPTTMDTATPTPSPTLALSIAVGGRVKVGDTSGANLRLRASPGLDSITFKIVTDGAVLEVLSGPEKADNYTWWRLKDEVGAVGWGAENWLIPLP